MQLIRNQKTIMHTASGQQIWYENPQSVKINWIDIAAGLRNKRYFAQIDVSILQHLSLGVDLCDLYGFGTKVKAYWSCHDLHEAYVLDIPQGMKEILPEYKERLEDPWEKYVHHNFGLQWPLDDDTQKLVKHVDIRTLILETWTNLEHLTNLINEYGGHITADELQIAAKHFNQSMSDDFMLTKIKNAIHSYTRSL